MIRRPNPLLWLCYQYGGRLPMAYREWMLHDGTCRTWLARVVLRGFLLVAPFVGALFVAFALLGASWYLALGAVALGVLVSVRYSLSYAAESVDGRLARHGYPPEHASAVRQAAYEATHEGDAERYRAAWGQPPDEPRL